jgi:hypothetical protein
MLTETEAKDKVCPLRNTSCLASNCAFWRWSIITGPFNGARRFYAAANPSAIDERDAGKKPDGIEHWQFIPCDDDSAGWLEPESDAALRRRGYCGIAGKPEGT